LPAALFVVIMVQRPNLKKDLAKAMGDSSVAATREPNGTFVDMRFNSNWFVKRIGIRLVMIDFVAIHPGDKILRTTTVSPRFRNYLRSRSIY
jgi:hypothetical protein